MFASAKEVIEWFESASPEEVSCLQELDLRFLDVADWDERYEFHLELPKTAVILDKKGPQRGVALRCLGLTGVAYSCLRE